MDYYIKKNDVVSLLMKEAKSHDLSFSAEAYERAANIVACMPNEDVQPVKHGKWLSHHAIWIDQSNIEGWFVQAKCSECEKWAHVMNPYTKDVDYKHCPHCGARMDKE